MKKVVWIVYWPSPQFVDLARELGKKVRLYLVLCDRYKDRSFQKEGYTPIYLPYLHFRHELIYFMGLENAIKTINPDIIISTLCFMPASWQAGLIGQKFKIKNVLTEELKAVPKGFLPSLYFRLIVRYFFKKPVFDRSSVIVCWTHDCLRFIKKLVRPDQAKKVVFVPPGITTDIFTPLITPNRNQPVLKLVAVSRMVKYKRLDDLIRACSILKLNHVKFVLTILGNGRELSYLTKLIKSLGLTRDITIRTDTIRHDRMKYFYADYNLLVLPSFNEAIGLVVPEALACGLHAIVSDTSGAKIFIKEGINGSVFKTYDYRDLALKIMKYRSVGKAANLGKVAHDYIYKNFDVQKTAVEFLDAVTGF